MSESFLTRASFFRLLNHLERYHQTRAPLGELGPADKELVRFKANPSLAFPGRDVASVEKIRDEADGHPPRYAITVNFLGLVGTVSPLPIFYTEEVLQSDTPEEAQRTFLDFFHHRLLSLFYRAGLKYRFLFGFQQDCSDQTSQRLLAIGGFAPEHSIESTGMVPKLLMRYAGLLYHRPHSASVLQTVLADYLGGAPVAVRQCTVRWVDLIPEQRFRLGMRNASLGTGAILGGRVRSCAGSFQVIVGPLSYEDFVHLLPCGAGFSDLARVIRLFVSDPLDFTIRLRVHRAGIPTMIASSDEPPLMGSRLGWTSWLYTRAPLTADRQSWRDVVFDGTPRRKVA